MPMNDVLPAPVAWIRVAPWSAEPAEIKLPDGCSILGYENDFDGFITLLVRHDGLAVVDAGGVIPTVRLHWTHPAPEPVWEVVGTFEEN